MQRIKYMVESPYLYGGITMLTKDTVIVTYLIEQSEKEVNIQMIAKDLGMDYKNVYNIVKRLEKNGLLRIEKFGNSNRITFYKKIHPLLFEAEHNRRVGLLKDKNLKVMLDTYNKNMPSIFFILLLFGSYANRTNTFHSDIDLLFISPAGMEELIEKEAYQISQLIPLNLHIQVFSETQFKEMLYSHRPNVVKEAVNNNVILHGIEYYYSLIQ